MQTSITVTIGPANIRYVLGVTTAPPEYDGFGTLTLYDEGEGRDRRRYVLIHERHEDWHRMRYSSGLYVYQPTDSFDERDVAERLYDAIYDRFIAAARENDEPETATTGDTE